MCTTITWILIWALKLETRATRGVHMDATTDPQLAAFQREMHIDIQDQGSHLRELEKTLTLLEKACITSPPLADQLTTLKNEQKHLQDRLLRDAVRRCCGIFCRLYKDTSCGRTDWLSIACAIHVLVPTVVLVGNRFREMCSPWHEFSAKE